MIGVFGTQRRYLFSLVTWSFLGFFFSPFPPLLGCSPVLVLGDGGGSFLGFWRGFG